MGFQGRLGETLTLDSPNWELARGPASVDREGLAGDQRGGVGGQEHDGAGDLARHADAVQRGDALDESARNAGRRERARCRRSR